MESITNLGYLLQTEGDERFDAFVSHGMRQDKHLYDLIHRNIQRQGDMRPIEKRMLASLEDKARLAGIAFASIPKAVWPSFEVRVKELGLEPFYIGYRTTSASIHGTWPDLVRNNLNSGHDFKPNFDWTPPRPQPLLATALTVCIIMPNCLERLGEATILGPRFADLSERAWAVDRAHEAWLSGLDNEKP